eukprot:CAMPEP_0119334596 /NCGR_PEP_ID=MMETSP1333-20130426/87654_1 /TAXON_ID=418940 /ORGANISM="Scyphosphaera apsteinii, Strain RCC1455" /LENGTH=281 /DNA_ID=CAMNT_0007344931 /DNA_START=273 /DNA_END=1118 /DNA_ORIENTATION=+
MEHMHAHSVVVDLDGCQKLNAIKIFKTLLLDVLPMHGKRAVLYLDVDVIVCRPLTSLLDTPVRLFLEGRRNETLAAFAEHGSQVAAHGGVLLMRVRESARCLESWRRQIMLDVTYDQPALRRVVEARSCLLYRMPQQLFQLPTTSTIRSGHFSLFTHFTRNGRVSFQRGRNVSKAGLSVQDLNAAGRLLFNLSNESASRWWKKPRAIPAVCQGAGGRASELVYRLGWYTCARIGRPEGHGPSLPGFVLAFVVHGIQRSGACTFFPTLCDALGRAAKAKWTV